MKIILNLSIPEIELLRNCIADNSIKSAAISLGLEPIDVKTFQLKITNALLDGDN